MMTSVELWPEAGPWPVLGSCVPTFEERVREKAAEIEARMREEFTRSLEPMSPGDTLAQAATVFENMTGKRVTYVGYEDETTIVFDWEDA